MRHMVTKTVFCTPQSPRRVVQPFLVKDGMMQYSSSAFHGMFLLTQRKILRALMSALVSWPMIFATSGTDVAGENDMRQAFVEIGARSNLRVRAALASGRGVGNKPRKCIRKLR